MWHLEVAGFRNLRDLVITPDPSINMIYGGNGTGKTSLLEAIYFLSRVRSFRTRHLDHLIQWGSREAQVYGVAGEERLGAGRSQGATRLRVNGRDAGTRSALAARLPVQIINSEHQRLLLDGPAVRRQFLDWGTFHVEPRYHDLTNRYYHALRQRNAALRAGDQRTEEAWRPLLADYAEAIDAARNRFIRVLEPNWCALAQEWLGLNALSLTYSPGGRQGSPWEATLKASTARDRDAGFTTRGPHRADLLLYYGRLPAREALSRGQQKLLIVAMLLAEAQSWVDQGLEPLLLIDDLPADLDAEHLALVLGSLATSPIQVFLTAIDPDAFPTAQIPAGRWYSAHDGNLRAMV